MLDAQPMETDGEFAADAGADGIVDAALIDGGAPEGTVCNLGQPEICGEGQTCTTLGYCAEARPPVIRRAEVRRGAGVIRLRVEVADDERDASEVVFELGGEEQRRTVGLTVAATSEVEIAWVTENPVGEGRIRAFDRAGLESAPMAVRVVPMPEIPAGGACDPSGWDNHCAAGALCLTLREDSRCQPVEAHFWPWQGGAVILDLTSLGLPPEWSVPTLTASDRLVSSFGHPERVDWRFTGGTWIEGPTDIRQNGHFVARRDVEAPPVRAAGDPCDRERLADQCAEDTACRRDGREFFCFPIQAPTLESVVAVWRGGSLALTARGEDPDGDVVGLRLEGLPEGPLEVRFETGTDGRQGGAITSEGPRFQAWYSGIVAGRQPARITATAFDAEGLTSPPFDLRVGETLIEGVAANAPCDPLALLFECPAEHTCTGSDADPATRCRRPDATCPGSTPVEDRVEGDLTDAPDHTRVTCGDGWGPDARHVFTAPVAGRYRFTLTTEFFYAYLALRRSCTQRAELSCTRAFEEPGVAEVELAAGESITAVVELAICRCNPGPYVLEVERM